ncbi:MAG: dimethylarginine dimethylaminohydrolase family protein [Rudaea sp.]
MFTQAIVRPPAANFADGLTTAGLGKPNLATALAQHARYCSALESCGLTLTRLPPNEEFPDATFIEDTAILTARCAILTHPGAPSRAGEVAGIAEVLRRFYTNVHSIAAPGTVDGGDVCDCDGYFLIGISARTNAEGARQLAEFLAREGFTSATIDIRGVRGILHLKSGISYLGDWRVAVIDTLAGHPALRDYASVLVTPQENYAANCLRINDHIIVAAGHPQFEAAVRESGHPVIALDMSEFRKMDGALTCLSLRF